MKFIFIMPAMMVTCCMWSVSASRVMNSDPLSYCSSENNGYNGNFHTPPLNGNYSTWENPPISGSPTFKASDNTMSSLSFAEPLSKSDNPEQDNLNTSLTPNKSKNLSVTTEESKKQDSKAPL
ncbi:MAG: hypothetical protein LBP31_03635 [Holosporales bacterium]|nr:hypothetical protein [Holosporales bacterium]